MILPTEAVIDAGAVHKVILVVPSLRLAAAGWWRILDGDASEPAPRARAGSAFLRSDHGDAEICRTTH